MLKVNHPPREIRDGNGKPVLAYIDTHEVSRCRVQAVDAGAPAGGGFLLAQIGQIAHIDKLPHDT